MTLLLRRGIVAFARSPAGTGQARPLTGENDLLPRLPGRARVFVLPRGRAGSGCRTRAER